MKKRKAKAIAKILLEHGIDPKVNKAGYRRAKAAYESMAQKHRAKI